MTWDFPGCPMVKTLCFQCKGCGFNPWELKSHMPGSMAKKKKKKNRNDVKKKKILSLCIKKAGGSQSKIGK